MKEIWVYRTEFHVAFRDDGLDLEKFGKFRDMCEGVVQSDGQKTYDQGRAIRH